MGQRQSYTRNTLESKTSRIYISPHPRYLVGKVGEAPHYHIDTDWMNRVAEVVEYAEKPD